MIIGDDVGWFDVGANHQGMLHVLFERIGPEIVVYRWCSA
jgi:hypothetical protein